MKKLHALVVALLLPSLLFGASAGAGDIKIPYMASNGKTWVDSIFPKTNNSLLGLDASGHPWVVTIGGGLSLVNGVLTNTGGGGGGSGTVTSVAASVPSFLSISGSPVTTSGTLAFTYSGTALPIANGGTGGTSANAARTALGLGTLATQSGTFSGTSSGTNTGDQNLFGSVAVSGQTTVTASANPTTLTLVAGGNITLTTDNTAKSVTIAASGAGGGGNTSATTTMTVNKIAKGAGTTNVQTSGVDIDASNNVTGINDITIGNNATFTNTATMNNFTVTNNGTVAYVTTTNFTVTGAVTGNFQTDGKISTSLTTDASSSTLGVNQAAISTAGGISAAKAINGLALGTIFDSSGTDAITTNDTRSSYARIWKFGPGTGGSHGFGFRDSSDSVNMLFMTDTAGTPAYQIQMPAAGGLAITGNATAANLSGTNTGDQSLFSSIVVSGQTTIVANSTTTPITFASANGNLTITTSNTTPKTVTFNATGGGGGSGDIVSPLVSAEIAITTTATATISREHVISGTTANYIVTLPPVSGNTGKFCGFHIAISATKFFTIKGNSAETIDGLNTRIMWAGESCLLLCDGSTWSKIAGKTIPMHARMFLTAAQSVTAQTATKVLVDTDDPIDPSSPAVLADTTNSKITIIRPGRYSVTGGISATSLGSGTVDNDVALNGGSGLTVIFFLRRYQDLATGIVFTQNKDDTVLAAGDFLELVTYSSFAVTPLALYVAQTGNFLGVSEIPSW